MRCFTVIKEDETRFDKKICGNTLDEIGKEAFDMIRQELKDKRIELDDIVEFRLLEDTTKTPTIYMFIGDPMTGEIAQLNIHQMIKVLTDRHYRQEEKRKKLNM